MSPEDPESRALLKRPLHGSLNPAAFHSNIPRSSLAPPPHGPISLRHVSSPGVPTSGSSASFSIVIGSPPKTFTFPAFGSPSLTNKKRGRTFKNPQATPIQPIAKKRGRPFRNPETAAAAVVGRAPHSTSTDQQPKKRGRPFKHPQGPEEVISFGPPEPKFVPFICEWKNCPAELHNLDTLRAHLLTVHLRKQSPRGPFLCLWKKCIQEQKVVDNTGVSKTINKGVEFETKEEWRNHIKIAHLDPIAWYQGDGPKTEFSFTERARPAISYTFLHGGPTGQATPSIRDQPIEEGIAKDNNAARFRKKRDGLYIILEPVGNPAAYMKSFDINDEKDEVVMDEP